MSFLTYVRQRLATPGPTRELMLQAIADMRVDTVDRHPLVANRGEAGRKLLRKILARIQHRIAQMQAQARDERRPLTEEEIGQILHLLSPDNDDPV